MKLNRNEVSRYLGYGTSALSAEVERYALLCEEELERTVVPRKTGRRLSLSNFPHTSRDLARHLEHCETLLLLAITLGTEADRLLRRWSAESMAKAAVGQACCAVWMDNLCDDTCLELGRTLPPGQYLTPPFSPGYGDWDLSAQGMVLDRLRAHKTIGLSLTAGGMLVPEKSITAVVGISDRREEACGQKCLRCKKKNCLFRKGK